MVTIPPLTNKKDWERMPPQLKEKETAKAIKEFVVLNKKTGITINDIETNSYFERHTISRYLNKMALTGEIYANQEVKPALFFPNGNVVDPLSESNVEIGGKFYTLYKLHNQFGDYYYVQEKRKAAFESLEISGGLIIAASSFNQFIQFLKESQSPITKASK